MNHLFRLAIYMAVLLFCACRQDTLQGSGVVADNAPNFYFRGSIGDSLLNIEAGRNYFFTEKPNFQTGDLPGNGGFSNDEKAFNVGYKYDQANGGVYYRLSLYFCLRPGDSLHTGIYPVAVNNPSATNVYSYGKVAAKIVDQLGSNIVHVSYSPLNINTSGQFLEITKIEPYSEPGVTGKKISYRLNMQLYTYPRFGTTNLGVKTLKGDGVGLLYP
jgi:hypothetical protein